MCGPLSNPSNAGVEAEQVCSKCPRLGTKPGRLAAHMTTSVMLSTYLDELRAAGATFTFPTAFPHPAWWDCLIGSHRGRQRHDEARTKREEAKRKADEAQRKKEEETRQGKLFSR